jgi:hypothetical protein
VIKTNQVQLVEENDQQRNHNRVETVTEEQVKCRGYVNPVWFDQLAYSLL